MLLQSLRHSRTLARMVLVWFVLAMGVAVAAPALQPLVLGGICSAAASAEGGQPDGNATSAHASLQCILCLGAGAPPVSVVAAFSAHPAPAAPLPTVAVVVALAPRNSPLAARAPPAL
jgi:hypothetical protein